MKNFSFLILAIAAVWMAVLILPDDKFHVVFCDVGQGDAILVTHKTTQLLIDGGPDKSVLYCLERHMPFFDRRIEAVVLTHRNSDHSRGLEYVRHRYRIMADEPVLSTGQVLEAGSIRFRVQWPDDRVLGKNTISEENEKAIVGKISFGKFDVLLTSDASTANYPHPGSGIEVVKVPHHGSKIGWEEQWWKRVMPKLAVVSVGKNSFGHPTNEVIKSLSDLGIKLLRTDQEGDIEIISDGNTWEVRK